jgi:hypothetical protein
MGKMPTRVPIVKSKIPTKKGGQNFQHSIEDSGPAENGDDHLIQSRAFLVKNKCHGHNRNNYEWVLEEFCLQAYKYNSRQSFPLFQSQWHTAIYIIESPLGESNGTKKQKKLAQ